MVEVWKKVPVLKNYEVSNTGKIRNSRNLYIRKLCLRKDGYLQIRLENKNYLVHRLVAISFLKNPKQKKEINHIDGNKLNNSINNLEWSTSGENQKHAFKNNLRSCTGVNHPRTNLTALDVKTIYKMAWNKQKTLKEIAKIYNISFGQVGHIKNGRSWQSVTKHKVKND